MRNSLCFSNILVLRDLLQKYNARYYTLNVQQPICYVVLTVRDSTLGTAVIEVGMGHSSRVTCHKYSYFGSICPTLFCVQVQPHLKKCFDNIKSLDMARMRDHMEATHMNSSEGEKVELKGVVRLEGVVEVRGW